MILYFSVHESGIRQRDAAYTSALAGWDGRAVPGEAAFAALVEDLRKASRRRPCPMRRSALNYELPGSQSMVMDTGRKAALLEPLSGGGHRARQALGRSRHLARRRLGVPRFTTYYLLAPSICARSGTIHARRRARASTTTLGRTIWMSLVVTLLCLAIGYPMAYLIANSPESGRDSFSSR
jgi:putative spermidine/putrescine transport system permease protein